MVRHWPLASSRTLAIRSWGSFGESYYPSYSPKLEIFFAILGRFSLRHAVMKMWTLSSSLFIPLMITCWYNEVLNKWDWKKESIHCLFFLLFLFPYVHHDSSSMVCRFHTWQVLLCKSVPKLEDVYCMYIHCAFTQYTY